MLDGPAAYQTCQLRRVPRAMICPPGVSHPAQHKARQILSPPKTVQEQFSSSRSPSIKTRFIPLRMSCSFAMNKFRPDTTGASGFSQMSQRNPVTRLPYTGRTLRRAPWLLWVRGSLMMRASAPRLLFNTGTSDQIYQRMPYSFGSTGPQMTKTAWRIFLTGYWHK